MIEGWTSADGRRKAFLAHTYAYDDDPDQAYVVSTEDFDGKTLHSTYSAPSQLETGPPKHS